MKTIYLDLETSGLNPHKDKIALAQLYDGHNEPELIPFPNLSYIHERLDAADRIVGHNLAFDFGFLRYLPKSIDHFDDTLYLSRVEYPGADSHSLNHLAERVTGADQYAGINKKLMQKADWSKLTPAQIQYAQTDVLVLPFIDQALAEHRDNGVYRFDKRSVIAGLRIQLNGLPILQNDARKELAETRRLRDTLLKQIPFNPNSPIQARVAMGLESTGDRVLAEAISNGNEMAAMVRQARKAIKQINFLEKLSAAPRFYGTLSPSTRSGRFASNNENIQNLPRVTKSLVGTDTSRVIISADFAQLELRTIACIAEDETMLDLFKTGADLHGHMAEQMYGQDYSKTQRQIAKTFNFSLLYGAGAGTVRAMLLAQTGINLPESEVIQLKKKWLSTFKGIRRWQREGSTRHERGMPWRTPHGRAYASKRFTDHLSIENQGAGAEVARIALHQILDNLSPQAVLIDFVHDSYLVEAPNDPQVYEPAAQAVYDAMKYAWMRAPFEKHGLEMPVDVGVAHTWKDADALENCLYVFGDG
jgi:DNA polymerase I